MVNLGDRLTNIGAMTDHDDNVNTAITDQNTQVTTLQGAANKSNPLPCFVNISTTNRNF